MQNTFLTKINNQMNLNEITKRLSTVISEDVNKKAYSDFVRKHVTYRGMRGNPYDDPENNAGARFGRGLYTTKDKSMARQYGTLWFVVGAIPKNPKIFNTPNDAEIWLQQNLYYPYSKSLGLDYDQRQFFANTTIEDEMQKLGYDGIVIKGREMVNFKPEDVRYFPNEVQLRQYFDSINY